MCQAFSGGVEGVYIDVVSRVALVEIEESKSRLEILRWFLPIDRFGISAIEEPFAAVIWLYAIGLV